MKHCFLRLVCAGLFLPSVIAAEEPEYKPDLEPRSDEAQQAIETFRLPDGMKLELAASEPDLANPVAFAFDEQGNIFVCETFRQSIGVEDNRGHMYWLEDDLKAQTVEDRRAYMLKHHPEKFEEWTEHHDRIRLLRDSDEDGVYEDSYVFADGFNDLVEGTGAGVLAFNGDIYYTCIPRLWKLRDTNGDHVADDHEVLHNGFGVRFAFRGHDMHGLVLGPDGRVYFSIGDRGFNVITNDGRVLKRPDTGAVFRCERDGSHLEVYAYGLRNPQELAFDDHGNLFTGDNNSDSGDKARWVYVAEGSDSGWRMYYQYLEDRGPWNRARMWYPFEADERTTAVQPVYSLPPIANLGDGPSGLVAYYGVGLPDRYRGHFFLADFRGQPANSGIRSFTNEPKGAGFQLADSHEYLWKTLATDVDFGYDGRLYYTDWVNGWNGLNKGRIYRQVPQDASLRHAGDEVARLFREGFEERANDELLDLLHHADRRVRQRAQIQLAERRANAQLVDIFLNDEGETARLHALWGLWEIARTMEDPSVLDPIEPIFQGESPLLIAQALRVIADCGAEKFRETVLDSLSHAHPRVVYHAALATGKMGIASAVPQLLDVAADRAPRDPVLRHAVTVGLTGIGRSRQDQEAGLTSLINAAINHEDETARLTAVVALRRLQSPEIALFLNDPKLRVVAESARAIHDAGIDKAIPALARQERFLTTSDALARRVINANYLLGQREHARRLVELAANERLASERRQQAMQALLKWQSGSNVDEVIGIYRERPAQKAPYLQQLVNQSLPVLFKSGAKLQELAVELSARLDITDIVPQLKSTLENESSELNLKVSALRALDQLDSEAAEPYVKQSIKAESPELRKTARALFTQRFPEQAGPILKQAIAESTQQEQQSAIAQLPHLPPSAARAILSDLLAKMIAGNLPLALHLDVLEAAKQQSGSEIQDLIKEYQAQTAGAKPVEQYRVCLEGGNPARGRDLFFGSAAASCQRCHVVNGQGGGVGPELSEIGKKQDNRYLLESIVAPNEEIAKGFETVLIVTIEGKVVSGIIKEETDETVTLIQPLGDEIQIPVDDIEERAVGKSGMPDDLTKQLSKSEIRDLVSYLATLTEKKSSGAHGSEE